MTKTPKSKRSDKPELSVRKMVAPQPIAASEFDLAERILARLVALAFVRDHPELFATGAKSSLGLSVEAVSVGRSNII